MSDKLMSMIGLATKARKTVSGEFAVLNAIKNKSANLVIIASDATDNTKKLFTDKTTFYEIPIIFHSDKRNLGCAIGKDNRSSIAVLDENFAKAIIKIKESIV